MPVRNPEYNPNWESIHDEHAAQVRNLNQETTRLMAAGESGTEHYAELEKQLDVHTQISRDALSRMKFPTIQGYAEWLFSQFSPSMGLDPTSIASIDLEQFTTLAEVNSAWDQIREGHKIEHAEKHYSMSVGQPENLDIFQGNRNNNILTYERNGVDIIVDARADEAHICFIQKPGLGEAPVINNIQKLASIMYAESAEAASQASKMLPMAGEDRTTTALTQHASGVSNAIHPNKFNFYVKTTPTMFFGERFMRVDMDYNPETKQFENPQWHHFDVVPEAVQNASKNLHAPVHVGSGNGVSEGHVSSPDVKALSPAAELAGNHITDAFETVYGKGDAGEAIEALNYLSNKDTPTKPVQSPQSLRQEFYKSRRPVIEQTGDALNAHKKLPPLEVTPEFIALKKDFYKQRRERFLTDRPSELSAEFAAGAHGNTIGQRAVGGMNMGMAGLMLYRAIHEMNSSGEKSGFKKGAITIDLLNAGAMTASEVRWPRLIGQEWA